MELTKEKNYQTLVKSLKQRIKNAQIRATLAANAELIHLYWDMGLMISKEIKSKGWGAKVIEQLSKDLKLEYPDMEGISESNLRYVRRFSETYPDLFLPQRVGKSEIRPQRVGKLSTPAKSESEQDVIAQIPWGHNRILLDRLKNNNERIWYAQQTIQYGWKRTVLEHHIASGLFERQGKSKKATNFKKLLPKPQSELAEQTLKDPYIFDFLNISKVAKEKNVEDQLITHITKFLMELGVGFAFVGRQHRLEVGGDEFIIDLLFYHIHLKCYVVIELKMEKFKPEYAGQLNFYLTAVDELLKRKDDNPSIGILLCPSKNHIVAEFSLRDVNKPIGISEYKLTAKLPEKLKKELPIEELKHEIESQLKKK